MTAKERYSINGVEIEPAYSPLKCSKDDNSKVCQFPFVLNGVVKWDCVEATAEDGWTRKAKVCNVNPSRKIQKFQDLREFSECGECSSSIRNGSVHFQGFGLANHRGTNSYARVETKEECQALCDKAMGCNFFNYNLAKKMCYLKYGVGGKVNFFGIYFGSKTVQGCFQKISETTSLFTKMTLQELAMILKDLELTAQSHMKKVKRKEIVFNEAVFFLKKTGGFGL